MFDYVVFMLVVGSSNIRIFCVTCQYNRNILRIKGGVKMAIYDKVKAACKDKGMTVSALEEQLCFARGSIYKWNINTPGVDKVKVVADKLEKPMEYFVE